eukprot:746403_1
MRKLLFWLVVVGSIHAAESSIIDQNALALSIESLSNSTDLVEEFKAIIPNIHLEKLWSESLSFVARNVSDRKIVGYLLARKGTGIYFRNNVITHVFAGNNPQLLTSLVNRYRYVFNLEAVLIWDIGRFSVYNKIVFLDTPISPGLVKYLEVHKCQTFESETESHITATCKPTPLCSSTLVDEFIHDVSPDVPQGIVNVVSKLYMPWTIHSIDSKPISLAEEKTIFPKDRDIKPGFYKNAMTFIAREDITGRIVGYLLARRLWYPIFSIPDDIVFNPEDEIRIDHMYAVNDARLPMALMEEFRNAHSRLMNGRDVIHLNEIRVVPGLLEYLKGKNFFIEKCRRRSDFVNAQLTPPNGLRVQTATSVYDRSRYQDVKLTIMSDEKSVEPKSALLVRSASPDMSWPESVQTFQIPDGTEFPFEITVSGQRYWKWYYAIHNSNSEDGQMKDPVSATVPVMSYEISAGFELTVFLSGLPNGVYTVSLSDEDLDLTNAFPDSGPVEVKNSSPIVWRPGVLNQDKSYWVWWKSQDVDAILSNNHIQKIETEVTPKLVVSKTPLGYLRLTLVNPPPYTEAVKFVIRDSPDQFASPTGEEEIVCSGNGPLVWESKVLVAPDTNYWVAWSRDGYNPKLRKVTEKELDDVITNPQIVVTGNTMTWMKRAVIAILIVLAIIVIFAVIDHFANNGENRKKFIAVF